MTGWIARAGLRGEVLYDEPMARHCSWRAGGHAECFVRPADLADLQALLRAAPADESLTWLGLGSNLLVRDGGIAGTVIATQRCFGALEWLAPGRLRAGSGAACAKLARTAARAGHGGGEFLAGIPGTLGGALAMNAGAFGCEVWELVDSADTIDRSGVVRSRDRDEFLAGYRSVGRVEGEWFVAADLRFETDAATDGLARIRELLDQRGRSQPIGLPSCGSVFKNPPGDHAGRLIEAAGLKAARRGGCVVSDKHANFIINDSDATAADIEALIELVRATVAARFGVHLETEVRIIGQAGDRIAAAAEAGGQ